MVLPPFSQVRKWIHDLPKLSAVHRLLHVSISGDRVQEAWPQAAGRPGTEIETLNSSFNMFPRLFQKCPALPKSFSVQKSKLTSSFSADFL